jgi:hypothetical protein
LAALIAACTPATPDYTPLPGASANQGASGASSGATGSPAGTTSGASETASGSPAVGTSGGTSGTAGGGGATGTGGGSAATAGAPGETSGVASGATAGSAGAPADSTSGASSGSPSADDSGAAAEADGSPTSTATGDGGGGGCNWIQDATTGLWSFDPAAPGKIVLFDGTQATYAMWHKENEPTVPIQWTLNGDGTMTVVPSGTGMATEIQSDMKFEDLCVHVEYQTPHYPSSVMGQLRGNSGVYLKSAYEMQILDSYGQPPDINTCGAAYSIMKPLVVACFDNTPTPPPWNTYEIQFKSSVWDTTVTPPVKTGNAMFVKCALNGQIVQLNTVLNPAAGYTQAGIPDAPGPQPLGLQDHLDLVSFRNVWVRVPQ